MLDVDALLVDDVVVSDFGGDTESLTPSKQTTAKLSERVSSSTWNNGGSIRLLRLQTNR